MEDKESDDEFFLERNSLLSSSGPGLTLLTGSEGEKIKAKDENNLTWALCQALVVYTSLCQWLATMGEPCLSNFREILRVKIVKQESKGTALDVSDTKNTVILVKMMQESFIEAVYKNDWRLYQDKFPGGVSALSKSFNTFGNQMATWLDVNPNTTSGFLTETELSDWKRCLARALTEIRTPQMPQKNLIEAGREMFFMGVSGFDFSESSCSAVMFSRTVPGGHQTPQVSFVKKAVVMKLNFQDEKETETEPVPKQPDPKRRKIEEKSASEPSSEQVIPMPLHYIIYANLFIELAMLMYDKVSGVWVPKFFTCTKTGQQKWCYEAEGSDLDERITVLMKRVRKAFKVANQHHHKYIMQRYAQGGKFHDALLQDFLSLCEDRSKYGHRGKSFAPPVKHIRKRWNS